MDRGVWRAAVRGVAKSQRRLNDFLNPLPGDLISRRLSHLNLLGDPPVQGSQEVNMPRTAWGFYLQEAVMP